MYARNDEVRLEDLKARWQAERARVSMLDVYASLQGGGAVKGIKTSRGYLVKCLAGHSDSNPSMHLVDQGDDHFFKSFCCGHRGDAAQLVRVAGEARTYPEALTYLHERGLLGQRLAHAQVVCISAGATGSRGALLRNRHIAGTYDYHNLDGSIAYRSVRIEGVNVATNNPDKTFELWHPGHEGDSCAVCTTRLQRLMNEAHQEGWNRERLERSVAYRYGKVTIGVAREILANQAVPAHPGEFRYGADGIERIPLYLPEVRAAVEARDPISFAEGEKKAEALRRVGFIATSAASGAEWRMPPFWAEHFRGARHVVILPDCDTPGREKCARPRAATLRNQGIPAVVFDLDPMRNDGFDIADWLDEHKTYSHDQIREEFKRLWMLRLTPRALALKTP